MERNTRLGRSIRRVIYRDRLPLIGANASPLQDVYFVSFVKNFYWTDALGTRAAIASLLNIDSFSGHRGRTWVYYSHLAPAQKY